jgi:hypothetical protein
LWHWSRTGILSPPLWYRAAPRLSLALLLGTAIGLPYAAVATAMVCLGSAMALPRLRQALHDIPTAEANNRLFRQQMAQLRAAQAAGLADVVVDGRLSPVVMLPTWLGLTDKTDDFANHDAAFYCGLKSVRVR